MFEITASGRLGADPWERFDGDMLVVCAWLWCDLRDDGAWIYLIAAKPALADILSGLRKDDRVTVSGEVSAVKIHADGPPFIELVAYSIAPCRGMVEAEQTLAVH